LVKGEGLFPTFASGNDKIEKYKIVGITLHLLTNPSPKRPRI